MRKRVLSTGNCAGCVVALLSLTAGLLITILLWWMIIGAIAGIGIMLGSLFMGGKRSRVWQCRACGAVVPRA